MPSAQWEHVGGPSGSDIRGPGRSSLVEPKPEASVCALSANSVLFSTYNHATVKDNHLTFRD